MSSGGEVVTRERPRVRLARLLTLHIRASEVLRFLSNHKGRARLDHPNLIRHMCHRGMLDPETAMISKFDGGAKIPTESAKASLWTVVLWCEDVGLIRKMSPKNRYRRVYILTRDGKATLADWDDTAAEGLFRWRS